MELFGTAGVRGDVRTKVTPELALAVGRAAGADGGEFVVGRDGRTTGEGLAAAMTAGLTSASADVVRAGQVPTPAIGYASRGRRGVVVTASHNPPTDNGIKLFADGQEYDDDAEARVEDRVDEDPDPAAWDEWGGTVEAEILPEYRSALVEYARDYRASLDGLHVAVDCGNGMASLATPQVLRELGADVHAIHANVDGHFSGRESKPTPETLGDLRAFVADGDADLGVAHDGDADRVVVVDSGGEVVHEDTVLAILAERYVRGSTAGDPVVVTTPNASGRIDERVAAAGGRVERVRLGALHVGIASAREAGTDETSVAFAAEPWKHIHTKLGGWIDGVASAAVLARLVAGTGLDALRDPVTERPYRKTEVHCPDAAKAAAMERVMERLPETFPEADVETEHGVRLTFDDGGWLLVRPSGTEPYLRLYVESEDVDTLLEEATRVLDTVVESTV
ncbi:MAG: phosphopentomutase/phosphoglucosamine mutase [Haloarculaceae archaeon]